MTKVLLFFCFLTLLLGGCAKTTPAAPTPTTEPTPHKQLGLPLSKRQFEAIHAKGLHDWYCRDNPNDIGCQH